MDRGFPSDFLRGYDYVRRRCDDLAAHCRPGVLLEVAAVLACAEGDAAELARGIAAGLEEVARGRQRVCRSMRDR